MTMTDLYHHLSLFIKETAKTNQQPLIVICGPTASGKTALSLKIARDLDGEIVSADSRQIYRKMDIGTDKISVKVRHEMPHHLVDIRDPDQVFTMADFKREATAAINSILRRGKIPIICGGTGLYISSVVENYDIPKAPPNQGIRDEIQAEYEKGGAEHIYQMLVDLDPTAAAKIHPNNVRFVARALEIVLQTQKPIQRRRREPIYHVFKVGIEWPRELLYERINKRIDEQIEEGLLNEIKTLLSEGYSQALPSMSGLGYKEYFPYLHGEKPLEDCKETLKQNTRKFAKRQLTWFLKDEEIFWISPEEYKTITQDEHARPLQSTS